VFPAYFEQNQADVLDLTKNVIETVQAASVNQSYNELRALLGQFLFKGDSVEKKVENLSGGEKARLSLCCMMLRVRFLQSFSKGKYLVSHVLFLLCFNRNPTS
jgi:ATP-binding cassette subfamily F protein 3